MTRRILSWFTLRPDRPRGDCQDFGDLSRFPAIQFSESGVRGFPRSGAHVERDRPAGQALFSQGPNFFACTPQTGTIPAHRWLRELLLAHDEARHEPDKP